MCPVPQKRALFRHLNFQRWSGPGVFCTCWLRNVLRTATGCTFSTSQLPKLVRTWSVLRTLTSKCASGHNGVQFFISHLASWLRTRRFSKSTFRPSGATNHGKNAVFLDFPTLSRTWIFFLLRLSLLWSSLFFSSLLFSSLLFSSAHPAFHLSILSEVWLLNFLRKLQLQLLDYNCNYNDITTTTTTTTTVTLHYTTPHYIQQLWLRWPLQPLQKAQLQSPCAPSVASLCHPCITATHVSRSFLSLKLPPPSCAVLLVSRVSPTAHACSGTLSMLSHYPSNPNRSRSFW